MGEVLREEETEAAGEQRRELHWESCTRLTATQRTLLWQLLKMFPPAPSCLLYSCSLFPPSGEETLFKPCWLLSSGSA